MKVYFIRHGETLLNRKFFHQKYETPLSEKGREQVSLLAESLKGNTASLILTSPLKRTEETACIIGDILSLPVEKSDLFREIERPEKIYGHSFFSLSSFFYIFPLFFLTQKKKEKRGESLQDFFIRIKEAFSFLEKREEESIIVITHKGFMTGVLCFLKREGEIDPFDFKKILLQKRIKNASYILCEWKKKWSKLE